MFKILLSSLFACAAYIITKWILKNQNFFKDHNVQYIKSWPLLGAFSDLIFNKHGIYEITKMYNSQGLTDLPFFGFFSFHRPTLIIKDISLINRILVSDFKCFSDRRVYSHDKDPLGQQNIFSVKNPKWKQIRSKLAPFFTNAKMKQMFYIFDKISSDMVKYINKQMNDQANVEMEVKCLGEIYSTDILASAAFGVEANSLENPDGEFTSVANHIFSTSSRRSLDLALIFIFPEVTKLLNIKMFTDRGSDFMLKTMAHVMNDRERSGTKRNDLVDALIEIKKTDENVAIEFLVAQTAAFLAAGYETSSGALAFALYELAKNQDIQQKVRLEIKECLVKNYGIISYDNIVNHTPFLDQVVLETFRCYPPLPFLDRECTNVDGYSLEPFSDFKIPYRMAVIIPIYPILQDEKYFDDPQKFDPDRFAPEQEVPKFFKNLPFGLGPRGCLGGSFGFLTVKIGIAKILKEFRLESSPNTPKEVHFDKRAFVVKAEEPLLVNIIKNDIMKLT